MRTVLVRRTDGTKKADTYTISDLYGDPLAVIPPETAAKLEKGVSVDDKELYVYTYDARHLCTGKRFPGQEIPTHYAYDRTNTLVASQSGNQKSEGRASFHLRDRLGRTAIEGEFSCADLSALHTDSTTIGCDYVRLGGFNGTGYEVDGLSLPSAEVRQACYYDIYAFFGLPGFDVLTQGDYLGNVNYARGKLTGEMRRADDGTCLYYAYFYDVMGNVVKTVSSDIRGEQEITETDWSFTGQPLAVRRSRTGHPELDETYTYTYDVTDRLTSVRHRLGADAEVTLAEYTYDALGRMKTKSVHDGTYSTQYAYDIRSWLTGISGNKFAQTLHYADGTGTPYYNGNLSSMTWKSGDETALRGYKFAYDGLDRLTSATYGEGSAISANADRFTEKVTAYDLNGNILGLQRYGRTGSDSYGLVDDLTLTLDGDLLTRVDDAAGTNAYGGGFEFRDGTRQVAEYAYDANGNLVKDLNKNVLSVGYNSLNLPCKVLSVDGGSIAHVYGPDGTKLRTVRDIEGTTRTTDYCGNVVYENGIPKLLLTEEGYVTLSDRRYHYYLKDHQGNNRVVLGEDGTVEEVNHYYPFGGLFAGTESVQPYKYNGKELEDKGGLDWYDYGARRYDAALGRFMTIDPSAESYYDASPYGYCGANPTVRTDPTGADWIQDRYGSYLWDPEAKDQETTRDGWIYVGAELPEDATSYQILEEIDGSLYHKNTTNPLACLVNSLLGEDVLVEKKAYNPSEDHMMRQFVETGSDFVIGAALGKGYKVLGKVLKGKGKGFATFEAFKKAYGPAGEGYAWHHIVEQNADNIAKFGAERIHNTKNLIRLPNGKGSIHAKISGFYSSKPKFTNGKTVRDWLKQQSFEQQYEFGLKTLKEFGWEQ